MNEITKHAPLSFSHPLTPRSPELDILLEVIAEGSAKRDLERIHPHEPLALIRQARLGSLRIPVADGGGGGSLRDLFEITIRLAAADSNVAHALRNHFTFVERYARLPKDDAQRRWRDAVLNGALVGLANGEPENKRVGGKGGLSTTLVPDGAGFRVTGRKFYSTGTLYSDLVVVRALTPDGRTASVIIPVNREGVELLDDWDAAGQRVTGTGTTVLTNVRVEPDEVVVDAPDVGYGNLYSSSLPQLFLTAVNAGILRAIERDASRLLAGRERTFYFASAEQPAQDPLLLHTIGQISSFAFAAETVILSAAEAQDATTQAREAGHPADDLAHRAALLAAQAKVLVDELVLRAGTQLFDVGGASATQRVFNLDRHWRNARTVASHNPRAYKARAIGDFVVNGTRLPAQSFF